MIMMEEKDSLDDQAKAHNAAHSWTASADTTSNTLFGFIKAMILYPEVQAQAQKELDEVVGSD